MRRHVFAALAGCLLVSCGGGGGSNGGDSSPGAPQVAAPAQGTAPAGQPPAAFAMCMSCHSVTPGDNRLGPSLFGVFGRKAGSEAGFAYSEAMKASGRTWDEATLDKYLTNPRQELPGNKMTFAGIEDPARRKAVIDYLKTLK